MTFLEAVILGVVEGLTEFLPISSTAHLLLTERVLGIPDEDKFAGTFTIVIQVGAIAAVAALYWRRLLVDRDLLLRVSIAFVPTGLIAYFLYPVVKNYLLKDIPTILWSLGIGGAVLILFEWLHGERKQSPEASDRLSIPAAIGVGLFQALALVPGVSRAAATVVGGMALGYRRRTMVEFSFLLAIPTMAAATVYELYKSRDELAFEHVNLILVGLLVSFVVALAAIRLLLRFVQTHTFVAFGMYRIVIAAVFAALLLGGVLC
jgi:undecaprenyl-diphosphatase